MSLLKRHTATFEEMMAALQAGDTHKAMLLKVQWDAQWLRWLRRSLRMTRLMMVFTLVVAVLNVWSYLTTSLLWVQLLQIGGFFLNGRSYKRMRALARRTRGDIAETAIRLGNTQRFVSELHGG